MYISSRSIPPQWYHGLWGLPFLSLAHEQGGGRAGLLPPPRSRCGVNRDQLAKAWEDWIFWTSQLLHQLPPGAGFKQPMSQCLAVLMGDAALQSNLSKTITKEFWPENHSKLQPSHVWEFKKCWESFEEFGGLGWLVVPFVLWVAFRVLSSTSLQIHLGSLSSSPPPSIHVRKNKVWNCELLSHLSVHKVTGKAATFFLLSSAMPHTFTVLSKVWVFSDLVASQCLLRDALHCPLLYFFCEEDCSASKIMLPHSSI